MNRIASSMVVAVDPSIPTHVPPPAVAGPYTVFRDRNVTAINAAPGNTDFIALYGRWKRSSGILAPGSSVTKLYGIKQSPAAVSTVWSLAAANSNLTAGGSSRARIHAMSISVRCTGTTDGTVPNGYILFGALNSLPISTSVDSTGLNLKSYLENTSQVKVISAYECLQKDITRWCYTLDPITWQEFDTYVGEDPVTDILSDALSPIGLYISDTSKSSWMITVRTEWCVIFGGSVNTLLSQTHSHHRPSSSSAWSTISREMSDLGGDISHMIERGISSRASSAIGALETSASRFVGGLGRAAARLV